MARYFQSIVTGRPLSVEGRSFIFEPVEPMGGSWTGVLAVEDDAAASVLAGGAGNSAWEITAEAYERLKKKRSEVGTSPGLKGSPPPQPPPLPIVGPAAAPVGAPTASPVEAETRATPAASETAVGPSVELLTTKAQPPPEPLLDTPAPKRKKAAKAA